MTIPEMSDLIICKTCGHKKLPEFFTIKVTTGRMMKTCDACRNKKIPCPHCDYKCNARHLEKHVRAIHDKIRDQQCPHCEFKCGQSGDLVEHVRSIHDQRCPKCEFKTSRTDNLTRHLMICTGGKHLSSGEYVIKGVLEAMNIAFIREMYFADCRNNDPLPFGFYIPLLSMAIEFDGRQHFDSIEHLGGQESLERTQRHDAIKNEYCSTNRIHLLRIKYTEFESIEKLIKNFISPGVDESNV